MYTFVDIFQETIDYSMFIDVSNCIQAFGYISRRYATCHRKRKNMEFNRDAVGKTILKYRLKKGLSQEITSGLADIQRSHLADIERGKKLPSLPTLWKLC